MDVRNELVLFARAFAVADFRYVRSTEVCANHDADMWKFSIFLCFSLPLCLFLERSAIDSAPVSGKRLHSLDQYLLRDSEFRLHALSDLAGVSREPARDSWPTSGDIHKARTLSKHPDAQSRVYSPNVLYGLAANATSSVISNSQRMHFGI